MSSVKAFNNQLVNFTKNLSVRFPDNTNFKLGLTTIETMANYNPKKNIDMFVLYVYLYKEMIMNKDEVKLLETDYVEKHKLDNEDPDAFNIMKSLKSCWSELNSTEKDNLWKYLQVLIKLSEKYISETLGQ